MKSDLLWNLAIISSIAVLVFTIFIVLVFAQPTSINDQETDINSTSRATTLYFSIQPLDTWIYQQHSKSAMAKLMGVGPSNAIKLWPLELDGVEDNRTS